MRRGRSLYGVDVAKKTRHHVTPVPAVKANRAQFFNVAKELFNQLLSVVNEIAVDLLVHANP